MEKQQTVKKQKQATLVSDTVSHDTQAKGSRLPSFVYIFLSVINENGCMVDTSFCETTDYDTDFIATDNLETDYLESDIEGIREPVIESSRQNNGHLNDNGTTHQEDGHGFDLPMSQIPDSMDDYPEDDFITQQING